MKTLLALALIALLALLTSGCGSVQPAAAAKDAAQSGPAQEVTLTATEMAFSPATIEVATGQPIKMTLKNSGVIEHNWQAKLGNETVLVTARAGQSASKTFNAPPAGTYTFICSLAGHEQAGMKGTLIVK